MSTSGARARAERAARERLGASRLRELAPPAEHDRDPLRLTLPAGTLALGLASWSPTGHHRLTGDVTLDDGGGPRPATHDEVVAAVLDAVGAAPHLAALVADSVARTARYLAHAEQAPARPCGDPTRDAEQGLLLGPPFHPTPKSAEGLDDDDLAAWAPELGASFVLHHLALDPRVIVTGGQPPAPPPAVTEHLPPGWTALPVHPFQACVLAGDPTLALLAAEGSARWLGPRGDPVWPTSSVRTVVDTVTGASWKLPLRARLTHFVRTT